MFLTSNGLHSQVIVSLLPLSEYFLPEAKPFRMVPEPHDDILWLDLRAIATIAIGLWRFVALRRYQPDAPCRVGHNLGPISRLQFQEESVSRVERDTKSGESEHSPLNA
jgi:hypothetical protein